MRENIRHADGLGLFPLTAKKTPPKMKSFDRESTIANDILIDKKFKRAEFFSTAMNFDRYDLSITDLVLIVHKVNQYLSSNFEPTILRYHKVPTNISLREGILTYYPKQVTDEQEKIARQEKINQLARSFFRLNITGTRLVGHVEIFLESVIAESKKFWYNPFRINCEVCASDMKAIKKYKEKKYISEIILIGTIPKKFKNDVSNMDISRATLENYATLKTMHFDQTKINRAQFLYLMKCNILQSKLIYFDSIDLSFANITHLDLRSIDFTQVYLHKTQDLTGCMITVAQANDLAKAGITTLKSAFILEEKGVDNRLNKLHDAVIKQGGKITISSKELEKLFETHRMDAIDLNHYQMTLPELEKMLKKLRAENSLFHKSLFHKTNSTLQLIKLIPFMQQQIKKYGIKKIILSNMNFENVNFSGFNFDNVLMRHCVFKKVDFENAHCEQAQIHACKFMDCSFDRIGMSKNTSFKDSKLGKDKENTENTINEVTYQYETREGKIATCVLRPNDFYTKIKERHRNILKTENKSRFFHGFFDKTDKFIDSNQRKDSSPSAQACFIGMLKINRQAEKNKKGVTARAMQAFFEEAAAAAPSSIASETAPIVMAH